MSPKEALQTFDTLLHHIDQLLNVDDSTLHSMLHSFTKENPNEGNQILELLQDRKSLEEERVRVMQMKIDFISEWLIDYSSRSYQDPLELDEVLKMLNIQPQQFQSIFFDEMKNVS